MKNAKWSARFFKFVYSTCHVTRPEPIKLLHLMNCGPPGFHLKFIFAQMEPKTCGPPSFLFSEKMGRPLGVFLMPYLSDLLPFMVIFEWTL